MAKGAREIIMMVSTGKNKDGDDTRYSYTTTKNKKTKTEKLEIMKFDPRAWNAEKGRKGLHVAFKEKKLPSSK